MSGKIHFRSEVQDVALCGSDDTFWGTSVSLTTCPKCREILSANASSSGDVHYREPGNEKAGSYCGSLEENWTTSDGAGEVTCRTCQTKLWAVGAARLAIGARLEAELDLAKRERDDASLRANNALAHLATLITAAYRDRPASELLLTRPEEAAAQIVALHECVDASAQVIRDARQELAEATAKLDTVAKRAFEDGATSVHASDLVQQARAQRDLFQSQRDAAFDRRDEARQKLAVAEALASRNASMLESERARFLGEEERLRTTLRDVEALQRNTSANLETFQKAYSSEWCSVVKANEELLKALEMNRALDASLAACRASYSEKQSELAQARAALRPDARDAIVTTLRRLVIRAGPWLEMPLAGASRIGGVAQEWIREASAALRESEPFRGSVFSPQHEASFHMDARAAFHHERMTIRHACDAACKVTWGPGPLEGDCSWCGQPRAEHAGQLAAELALSRTLLTSAEKRREDDERRFNETLRECRVERDELRNRIESMRSLAGAWDKLRIQSK